MKKFWLAGLFLLVALGGFGEDMSPEQLEAFFAEMLDGAWVGADINLRTKLILESRDVVFIDSETEIDPSKFPRSLSDRMWLSEEYSQFKAIQDLVRALVESEVSGCRVLLAYTAQWEPRFIQSIDVTVYFPARP